MDSIDLPELTKQNSQSSESLAKKGSSSSAGMVRMLQRWGGGRSDEAYKVRENEEGVKTPEKAMQPQLELRSMQTPQVDTAMPLTTERLQTEA